RQRSADVRCNWPVARRCGVAGVLGAGAQGGEGRSARSVKTRLTTDETDMKSILTDIRFGLRGLVRQPGFTAVAVLTLALGVGANTALFSVVDAMLLKKLPVKDPDQLVLFKASWGQKFGPGAYDGSNMRDQATGLNVGTSFPLQTLTRLRQEQGVLWDVFAFYPTELNFNAGGQAEVVSAQVVSGNYYTALGVPALIGRTITDADDNTAASPIVVLSHRFWASRFNGDPAAVGKQVNIN